MDRDYYFEKQKLFDEESKRMIKFLNERMEVEINGEGYIYIIRDYYGNCKIGCAENPKVRIQNYITYHAYPLEIVSLLKVSKKFNAEKYLHNKFWNKRISRERFTLSDEDIKYINNLPVNFYRTDG